MANNQENSNHDFSANGYQETTGMNLKEVMTHASDKELEEYIIDGSEAEEKAARTEELNRDLKHKAAIKLDLQVFIMEEIEARENEYFAGLEVNPKEQRSVKLNLEELRVLLAALCQ